MGLSRQAYWSGLPCPLPGDPPDPGVEPLSPAFQEDSLCTEPPPVLLGGGVLALWKGVSIYQLYILLKYSLCVHMELVPYFKYDANKSQLHLQCLIHIYTRQSGP